MKMMSSIIFLLVLINCGSNAAKQSLEEPMKEVDIIEAVEKNRLDVVQRALTEGADVNLVDKNQRSLLLIATREQLPKMATLLVEHGADVNQQDNQLDSPFLYAGATGQTELLKLFLANGAKFDVYNRYGGTPLIPAAERAHIETVKLLANTPNFPINHVNRLGWTALMEAVILGDGSNKYVETIQLLLDAGADRSIPDKEGVTPLQHAQRMGFKAIENQLK